MKHPSRGPSSKMATPQTAAEWPERTFSHSQSPTVVFASGQVCASDDSLLLHILAAQSQLEEISLPRREEYASVQTFAWCPTKAVIGSVVG